MCPPGKSNHLHRREGKQTTDGSLCAFDLGGWKVTEGDVTRRPTEADEEAMRCKLQEEARARIRELAHKNQERVRLRLAHINQEIACRGHDSRDGYNFSTRWFECEDSKFILNYFKIIFRKLFAGFCFCCRHHHHHPPPPPPTPYYRNRNQQIICGILF